MAKITNLSVKNFMSFDNFEIELGDFNVLIGANASGKSNFFHIFKFLRDIANNGLENAISMQGGTEYITNLNIGSKNNLRIEISGDFDRGEIEDYYLSGFVSKFKYVFSLKLADQDSDFEVMEDTFSVYIKDNENDSNFFIVEINPFSEEDKFLQIFTTNQDKNGSVISYVWEDDYEPKNLKAIYKKGRDILLSYNHPLILINDLFKDIKIFDIDPKLSKRAIPLEGKAELEENGNNLSIILKRIFNDKNKKRMFLNLINDILPFINEVNVDKETYGHLIFKIEESYNKDNYLPANMLSDGTINIAAIIVALYFDKSKITLIEEPERNIHPHLTDNIIEMMKDVNKQIFITTHNPEVVRNVEIEDLLLISRNKEGFSRISRVKDKKYLKNFLKNNIGIDELFIQNLLDD